MASTDPRRPVLHPNAEHDDKDADETFEPAEEVGSITERANAEQDVGTDIVYLPNQEIVEDNGIADPDEELASNGTHEEDALLVPLTRCHSDNDFASREKIPWFLGEADPESSRARRLLRRTRRNVVLNTVTTIAIIILFINFVTLLALSLVFSGDTLYRGECATISALNTFIHVIVNVVSTALLGCSNLCMQLLVAPTRQEVETAHAKISPVSLDIGVPSVKNLRFISRKRATLWILLGAASLPLHLLYNSVFFATQPLNSYTLLVVQPSFLTGEPVDLAVTSENSEQRQKAFMTGYSPMTAQYGNWSLNPRWGTSQQTYSDLCGDECTRFRIEGTLVGPPYTNITRMECLRRYRTSFGNHSDVILVSSYDILSSKETADGPLLHVGYNQGPVVSGGNDWVWGSSNTFSRFDLYKSFSDDEVSMFQNWNVFGYRVDYCLSRQWDNSQACALGFSAPMLTAVCLANLLKVIGIAWTAVLYSRSNIQPISTLGDALASFLHRNDPFTRPQSKFEFDQARNSGRTASKLYQALSPYRWAWLFGPVTVFVSAGIVALVFALRSIRKLTGSSNTFASLGFGKQSEYAISTFAATIGSQQTQKFYACVLFANIWQLVLSMIYFQYNGVLTAMLASGEWTRYRHRKSLRLTFPEGTTQRTSYFVSMPWRFGGPLLAASAFLHWSLSQSIFIMPLEQIDKEIPKNILSESLNTVNGFSVWAIIVSMVVGIVLSTALCIYGCKPFEAPIAQGRPTDSIVISGACHQPQPFDRDARLFPVTYGIVSSGFYRDQVGCGKGVVANRSLPNGVSASDVELQSILKQNEGRTDNVLDQPGVEVNDGYLTFTTYRHARPAVINAGDAT